MVKPLICPVRQWRRWKVLSLERQIDPQSGKATKRSKTGSGCPFRKPQAIAAVRDQALLQVQVNRQWICHWARSLARQIAIFSTKFVWRKGTKM